MISSVVVSYKVRPEAVAEHVRLIEAVFEQVRAEQPGNVEYKVVRLDDGVHPAAPFVVRKTDHGAGPDGRMLGEGRFDLGRIHVRPADQNHVLRAVAEIEVALVIEPTHVAQRLPPSGSDPGLCPDVPVGRSRPRGSQPHLSLGPGG